MKGLISNHIFSIDLLKRKKIEIMEHVTAKDISEMEKSYRRNLINCCTGYKTASLIATKSTKATSSVAVFNSVFHMGSNPPMLGLVLRSQTVPKSTYRNIVETKSFTVNHIQENMIEQAHQTAVEQEEVFSDLDNEGLEQEILDDFFAPYVKQSSIKLGCNYLNEYKIKENDTLIIVASIEHIYFEAGIQLPDGWLRLDDAGTVAFNGLDAYVLPNLLDRFPYAKPGQEIKSYFKK